MTRPTPAPIPSLEEFLDCCAVAFGFLVSEYGFERLDTPREYNQFSVRFRKGDLAVEIYGENWGQSASCDLLRGKDNVYLGYLVPASERSKGKPRRTPLDQLSQVRKLAEVVRLHAADFLSGDLGRFEAALAEWKRITAPRPYTEEHRRERELRTAVTEAGHASRRGQDAEVVRLLEPHLDSLSRHQRRMLDAARERLAKAPRTEG